MPLTKEDLDKITRGACPCGCGSQEKTIHPECHRWAGVLPVYKHGSGVLRLECAKCGRPVVSVAVADVESVVVREGKR